MSGVDEVLAKLDRLERVIADGVGEKVEDYRSQWPHDVAAIDILREVVALAAPVDPEAQHPLLRRVNEMLDAVLALPVP